MTVDLRTLALACLAVVWWGCPDEPVPSNGNPPPPRRDSGPQEDGGSPPGPGSWTTKVVASDDVGRYASLDVADDGTVGVAYFAFQSREDGICEEVSGEQPPRTRFPLYYSQLAPGAETTDWLTEVAAEPLHLAAPSGVSFRFSPTGQPALALFGGDPVDVLCSANDALWGTRDTSDGWDFELAAGESGDTAVPAEATCPAAASTAGYAVGAWPALAFDSQGRPAIAYRDIHFGGMQRDDTMRADAELAYRDGGWSHLMVDCGAGGGRNNAVVFDSQDRPVVLHRIPRDSLAEPRHGLWVHRQETDGTWLRTSLTSGQVDVQESSMAAGDESRVAVVYYDPGASHPFVAELEDTVRFADGASWNQVELGNNSFVEGQYPSIAWSPSGTLAVAYYRCTRNSGDDECDPDHDALIYAWRNDEGDWRYETVDEGASGRCGTYASLAFGPDGTAWIAYVCVRQQGASEFISQLKVARRRAR